MKAMKNPFLFPLLALTVHAGEPRELAVAMDLYQDRKYAEAKSKFIEVKERFKADNAAENNPSSLAAFYETECLRKLGDLEGLADARRKFVTPPLTRAWQLRQLEIDELWEAVRTKNWARVETLAKERTATCLPGDQRAQVAYCHGLALEALGRPTEALLAFNIAMTADAGASEEIARQAALHILGIHQADPEVQAALKLRGTKDEDKASNGSKNLTEAAAVAELFQLSLGGGTPLPAGFAKFLQNGPPP